MLNFTGSISLIFISLIPHSTIKGLLSLLDLKEKNPNIFQTKYYIANAILPWHIHFVVIRWQTNLTRAYFITLKRSHIVIVLSAVLFK